MSALLWATGQGDSQSPGERSKGDAVVGAGHSGLVAQQCVS
jgi:hypothetical protein